MAISNFMGANSSPRYTYFDSQLPWASSKKENARFFVICLLILAVTIVMAVLVTVTEVSEVPREEKEKLPPQLAQIIEAQEPPPPPPQIEPEPEPEPEPELEPEPEVEPLVEIPEPLPEPEVVQIEEPEVSEEDEVVQARETAKSSGVLALQDQLASMRDQANLSNLANTDLTEGGGESNVSARDVIASSNISTSGGIQTSDLSSDVGAAGELEGRRNTEFVAASEGEAALATKRIERESQVVGDRDLDQIRQILDANQGAVYSLYRRALREDPTIEGKLTVKLIIAPDGSLSDVLLIDSELDAPELVERLLTRIGLINFGAQNVTQTELEYAFNFLPF